MSMYLSDNILTFTDRLTSITAAAKLQYLVVPTQIKLEEIKIHQDAAVSVSSNTVWVGKKTQTVVNDRIISITFPTTNAAHKVTSVQLHGDDRLFQEDEMISLETDGGGTGDVNLSFTLVGETSFEPV